ncbi:uncharacterized protein LOC126373308 [Pectinophora gossypiella]|uniref:uncharacterized protein LOC126373308 n=1 Tax=Pectinophora gossypiella TaxID=13191 RepID=UPI00214E17EF|nr:uncharacterized protein LOC126373308 [Pectinophora gossypiella]XP_049875370.1 uncharacterized protein LOC126373308 [Pectinophora gossypiella]
MASKNLITLQRTLKTLQSTTKCTSVQVRKNSNWTQDKIVKSPFKNIEIPNCTLFDYVWQNLERWPERTLSVCAVTGRGYTYEQAFTLSSAFAANLRKKFKIRDGDTVSVMLPNIPDFPLVATGILEAGGVISTINPVYTANEIQRQLLMSKAKIVVTTPELAKVVKEALKLAKLDLKIIVVRTNGESAPEGTVLFSELSEDVHIDKSCLKEVRRSPNDISFLPYSSGTTGLPKGVELSNKNIIANCEQINENEIRSHNETTATHQDAVMSVLPFYHIYGATVIMFHKMSQGVKLVTLPKLQPDVFLQGLEKHKTNVLFVAPPLVLLMATHPAATPETYRHLELVINGAAPLTAADAEKFLAKAQRKIDFRQGYGLTETSPVVALSPKGLERYGSVGPALPSTELKIVDGNLKNLGPNETGELLVRGPQVMRGYSDNPQANAEVFTVDGWFRTGDLAVIDDDGFVTIADRLKELIKVKGYQVPPAELEGVLREHPAVCDAAVVGVPHPKTGEVPKAFVVLKQGQKVQENDITEFVKERVAPFKRIENVTFLESIPKNSSGKIMRKELKEKYCN